MSHYKPYPVYRDSGVEWIGQVPEHWKVGSVKYWYQARLGKMIQPESKSDEDVLVPYHRAQTVQWEQVVHEQVESMWASPQEIETYSLIDGDLLICEGGDVCRAAIFKNDGNGKVIFQNSIHRVRPLGGNQPEWLLHLMKIVRSSGWIDVLCSKNTIVHFTSEKLASLECTQPPISEQLVILANVHSENLRIDSLITKKTRFIELLKEKRQALITHAVTKGLDPNAQTKDSKIEWIGEVPAHWSVQPIKYLASIGNGSTPSKENSEYWEHGTLPWLTSGCVNLEVVDSAEQFVTDTALRECHLPIVSPPAVLVGITGQGKTRGMASMLLIEATINQHIAFLKPTSENICIEYLRRFLDAAYAWLRFDSEGVGSTKGAITCEQLANTKIALPPLHEQESILDVIHKKAERLDLLVSKTQRSIDLLKERRAAFITAAVTGQIDLRESA